MIIIKDRPIIPATRSKNLLLFTIIISTVFVNMENFADGDIIRGLIVLLISSLAMLAIMKHGPQA